MEDKRTGQYAEVAVDLSVQKLDRPFTYAIPESLEGQIVPGTPVMVPFGNSNRLTRGYVTALTDQAQEGYAVKTIDSVAPRRVPADDETIELALWMKDRYGCTFPRALQTVLPVRTKIRSRKDGTYRNVFPDIDPSYELHAPDPAQQECIDRFRKGYDSGSASVYLLFGVTGSGKTDTYIHMMRHVVDSGRQVILLIPEIALTYQTITRLNAAFRGRVAVVHSRLSDGERYDQFRRCAEGDADVIVGPRSALFAPFRKLGLIVIDEEHDSAYKNETVPRYTAAETAMKRASMHGASVVLASATPSLDSYRKAQRGEYVMLRLRERVQGARMPEISVVDMRQELAAGNRSIFSAKLDALIRDRLEKKEQVILFMNRRGYSSFVSCRSCGEAIRCPHCDVSLTVHRGRKMMCHYCGYTAQMPDHCPSCGSPYLAEFGVGTQKLETMARAMYPQARIARLDTDITVRKHAAETIIESMRSGETDILIGTQMVVKGHDFPNVTLVGIMAADTSLYVSDYTAAQRTYELVTQAAGRAGRAVRPGEVVVQTYVPDHYALRAAQSGSYELYYENEYAFREMMHYPPYVSIMTVQVSGKEETAVREAAEQYAEVLSALSSEMTGAEGTELTGPVPAAVYKVNDYYRMMIFVKHPEREVLLRLKEEAAARGSSGEHHSDISFLYDFS